MKKIFFIAATAALALSSCSSDEQLVESNQTVEEGAVAFNAYSERTTRAAINELAQVKAQGFGVFAYDQGTSSYLTYSSNSSYPNFMYNQRVAFDHTNYEFKDVTLQEWDLIDDAEIRGKYNATIGLDATPIFTAAEKEELEALGSPWNGSWPAVTGGFNAPTGTPTLTLEQYHSLSSSALKSKFIVSGSWTKTSIDVAGFNALPFSQKAYVVGTGGTDWKYSPIKYYNNNEGAMHSFFAYAPYNEDVKNVFTIGNAPAIRYNAADDYDLLYTKAHKDMYKPGVTQKIDFNFKHALSQVNIFVAPFVNAVHSATDGHTGGDALNPNTKIVVRSVKFVGTVASQALLNLEDGKWSFEATEESAYEVHDPVVLTTETTKTAAVPTYKPVKTGMMVIPTLSDQPVKIQIVYDVITTDSENSVNSSTITNTIVSKEEFTLAQSTAYNFFLDLGMTDVKFTASVKGWEDLAPTYVDLPNNILEAIAFDQVTALPTVIAVSSFLGNFADGKQPTAENGKYYYNTTNNKLMLGSSTDPSVWQEASANDYICNYTLYQKETPWTVTSPAPQYVTNNTNYWKLDNGAYTPITVDVATYASSTVEALVEANPATGYYKIGDIIYYYKKQA